MQKRYTTKSDGRDDLTQWFSSCWIGVSPKGLKPRVYVCREVRPGAIRVLSADGKDKRISIDNVKLVPDKLGFVRDPNSFWGATWVGMQPRRQYKRGLPTDYITKEQAEELFFGPTCFAVDGGEVRNRDILIITEPEEVLYYKGLLISDPLSKEIILSE